MYLDFWWIVAISFGLALIASLIGFLLGIRYQSKEILYWGSKWVRFSDRWGDDIERISRYFDEVVDPAKTEWWKMPDEFFSKALIEKILEKSEHAREIDYGNQSSVGSAMKNWEQEVDRTYREVAEMGLQTPRPGLDGSIRLNFDIRNA